MLTRFPYKLSSLCLSVTLATTLAGCGGASDSGTSLASDTTGATPVTTPTPPAAPVTGSASGGTPGANPAPGSSPAPGTSAPTPASCSTLPALPSKPANARRVTDFGAKGDGSTDDTAAIQRALDALQPGEWLVFPKGSYVHSQTLHVRVPDTVLWSEEATLHATNPNDMAVMLEANGASVYNFTLTAVTGGRLTAPWHSRIAVFRTVSSDYIYRNVIRGNRIVHAGAPGTPLANSSSSAAIFIYRGSDFLIAENTVSRSLADAIHMTAGSRGGRVLKNTVREPGDDMIAVVSYLSGDASTPAADVLNQYSTKKSRELAHDILIANNDVAGQYWGRGITVVGGEGVTIENNRIDRPNHAAAIYLAREISYITFGVRNVIVRNNTITNVQTEPYSYTPDGQTRPRTGHGAFEIYSWLFTDEASNTQLAPLLAVQQILVENNTVDRTLSEGFRIGNGWGSTWTYSGKRADGSAFSRQATGGPVGLLSLIKNSMSRIGTTPISIRNQPTPAYNVFCQGNTADGNPTSANLCSGSAPVVTGATLNCG